VLNGELAVPCNLQSATAGLKLLLGLEVLIIGKNMNIDMQIFFNVNWVNPVRPEEEQR